MREKKSLRVMRKKKLRKLYYQKEFVDRRPRLLKRTTCLDKELELPEKVFRFQSDYKFRDAV